MEKARCRNRAGDSALPNSALAEANAMSSADNLGDIPHDHRVGAGQCFLCVEEQFLRALWINQKHALYA